MDLSMVQQASCLLTAILDHITVSQMPDLGQVHCDDGHDMMP